MAKIIIQQDDFCFHHHSFNIHTQEMGVEGSRAPVTVNAYFCYNTINGEK